MNKCNICGSRIKLHKHHILPVNKNGKNSNKITVCSNCHKIIHYKKWDKSFLPSILTLEEKEIIMNKIKDLRMYL